jgi:hypothetical protein
MIFVVSQTRAYVAVGEENWLCRMQKWSFSMKSSSSGRTLAATNERQFLQVDSVSRAFWRLRLRLNTPYSQDFLDPPEAFMEFLQI